jgi:hypothetical protein
MAQTRQPVQPTADPNAGAKAGTTATARPDGGTAAGGAAMPPAPSRPGKSLADAPNAGERAQAAPGTGTKQTREPSPGERMLPLPAKPAAGVKGPGHEGAKAGRGAP